MANPCLNGKKQGKTAFHAHFVQMSLLIWPFFSPESALTPVKTKSHKTAWNRDQKPKIPREEPRGLLTKTFCLRFCFFFVFFGFSQGFWPFSPGHVWIFCFFWFFPIFWNFAIFRCFLWGFMLTVYFGYEPIYHTSYIIHHTSYIIYHISYIIYHVPYTIYHIP